MPFHGDLDPSFLESRLQAWLVAVQDGDEAGVLVRWSALHVALGSVVADGEPGDALPFAGPAGNVGPQPWRYAEAAEDLTQDEPGDLVHPFAQSVHFVWKRRLALSGVGKDMFGLEVLPVEIDVGKVPETPVTGVCMGLFHGRLVELLGEADTWCEIQFFWNTQGEEAVA